MKLIKYPLILLFLILLLGAAVWVQRVDPEQKQPDIETYVFADTLAHREYDLDSLKDIIGDNKGLPEGFEVAAAIAYSAYPQLKDLNIDMILTQDGPPMMASLNIWSLLGPRKHREYRILLNDARNVFFDPIFTSFPSF